MVYQALPARCPFYDVAILGAGVAGIALAWSLQRRGLSVALIDADSPAAGRGPEVVPISSQVSALLRDLGLWDRLQDLLEPVPCVAHFRDGDLQIATTPDQFVARYDRFIRRLRSSVGGSVDFLVDAALRVEPVEAGHEIALESGNRLQARFVAVACGGEPGLPERLGLQREMISQDHITRFTFRVELKEKFDLPYPVLRFWNWNPRLGFHSVTFCRHEGQVQGELLTYWPRDHSHFRAMASGDGERLLRDLVPGLEEYVGSCRFVPIGETRTTSLVRTDDTDLEGMVVLGDAALQACPASGLGLERALFEARHLGARIPEWIALGAIGTEISHGYTLHPERLALSERALRDSLEHRELASNTGLAWHLHRWAARRRVEMDSGEEVGQRSGRAQGWDEGVRGKKPDKTTKRVGRPVNPSMVQRT